MPKKRYICKVVKNPKTASTRKEYYQRTQMNYIQRNKENTHGTQESTHLVTDNDPLLTCVKIEIEEPVLNMDPSEFDFNQPLEVPLKIEKFETLECNSIKEEDDESDNPFASLMEENKTDLNILIEWALNLQFDHSRICKGRLYPCKEIFDNFNCKIIVLYCTVCKKRMLHTLKDWTTLQ